MRSMSPPSSPLARKRCPEFGFFGLSASSIDLSAIHEDPCHGHNDADFDVNAPLPCPVQIGVCSQSRSTPALQTTVVHDTQKPYRECPCCDSSAPFSEPRECLSQGERRPSPFIMTSSSENPVWMHNINATADVSPCNRISTIIGQYKACPDRDDNERTRPVTTPSVRTLQSIRPRFVPLGLANGAYDASLTYISDHVVLC